MAKEKESKIILEREYIVPLRKEIMKVPKYRRTPKAIKALKQFIAKHMRIPERDISKVKLDKYLNEQLWARGMKNPLTKIKVKAKRDGENILVQLLELPEKLKFKKAREDKIESEAEKIKKKKAKEEKAAEQIEESAKDIEEKETKHEKEEKEKEKSSAEAKEQLAQSQAKQAKHMDVQKTKKTTPFRQALKK